MESELHNNLSFTEDAASELIKDDVFENYSEIAIVTDQKIALLYQNVFSEWEEYLNNRDNKIQKFLVITIPEGEASKRIEYKINIENYLFQHGISRKNSCLVAFGGGVVGDLAGFVASTYKRGIDFIQIPTSLLAMVDSSIGGKNGINNAYGKNLVGTFYLPKKIIIAPKLLETLLDLEWSHGMAEVIKTALVSNSELWSLLNTHDIKSIKNSEVIFQIVKLCSQQKYQITQDDVHETSDQGREILNFGHTIAHILEGYYMIPHGKAVSIGIGTEILYGEYTPLHLRYQIYSCLRNYGLPYSLNFLPQLIPPDQINNLLLHDKKDGKMITITDVSKPEKVDINPQEIISLMIPNVQLTSKINTEKTHRLNLPSSKSETNRALILAAFGNGTCIIKNPLFSEDTGYMCQALIKLGVEIKIGKNIITVTGVSGKLQVSNNTRLYLGQSGTCLRFLSAAMLLLTTQEDEPYNIILTGETRLYQRPLKPLLDVLEFLGLEVESTLDNPLKINTLDIPETVSPNLDIDASISSQFVSALLMVAPNLTEGLKINLKGDIVSPKFIDLTLHLMKSFGITSNWDHANNVIKVSSQTYTNPEEYVVSGDATASSYLIGLSLLHRFNLYLPNLNSKNPQGDLYFSTDLMQQWGDFEISIDTQGTFLTANSYKKLKDGTYDLDSSDVFLTYVVIASLVTGTTVITNIANQNLKECDRISSIVTELSKLGIDITHDENSITVQGQSVEDLQSFCKNKEILLECYGDHRMTMSLSLLASIIPEIILSDYTCVNKTYPDYWNHLSKIGIHKNTPERLPKQEEPKILNKDSEVESYVLNFESDSDASIEFLKSPTQKLPTEFGKMFHSPDAVEAETSEADTEISQNIEVDVAEAETPGAEMSENVKTASDLDDSIEFLNNTSETTENKIPSYMKGVLKAQDSDYGTIDTDSEEENQNQEHNQVSEDSIEFLSPSKDVSSSENDVTPEINKSKKTPEENLYSEESIEFLNENQENKTKLTLDTDSDDSIKFLNQEASKKQNHTENTNCNDTYLHIDSIEVISHVSNLEEITDIEQETISHEMVHSQQSETKSSSTQTETPNISNTQSLDNDTKLEVDDNFPIILIGMPCSGKTYFGRLLQQNNKWSHGDTDHLIKRKYGMTSEQIIEKYGMEKFRSLEYKIFEDALGDYDIISTGGGIIETVDGRELLQSLERVIYIYSSLEVLEKRYQEKCKKRNIKNIYKDSFSDLYKRRHTLYLISSTHTYYALKYPKISHNNTYFLQFTNAIMEKVNILKNSNFLCIELSDVHTIQQRKEYWEDISHKIDCLELRLDGSKHSMDKVMHVVYHLRDLLNVPIIATMRSKEEGGKFTGTRKQLSKVIDTFIRSGFEFIDYELNTTLTIEDRKHATIIGSCHTNDLDTVQDIVQQKINMHQPDFLKLVVCPEIYKETQELTENLEIKHLVISSGQEGKDTRISNSYLTPITHTSLNSTAEGQLDLEEILEIRKQRKINHQQKFYLLGHPIEKSPSPFLHNQVFKSQQHDWLYELFSTKIVDKAIMILEKISTQGASITTPLKESLLSYVDMISPEVQEIGALNTIFKKNIDGEEYLCAYNTDWLAIRDVIKEHLEKTDKDKSEIKVAVIGSGGSAKAAYYAVRHLELNCEAYARNSKKLNLLQDKFEFSNIYSGISLHQSYDIVVNCIPPEVEVDYSKLSSESLVIEMGYKKRSNGIITLDYQLVDGYEILYRQAYYQYCIWNSGICPEQESEYKKAMQEYLENLSHGEIQEVTQ